MGEAIRTYRDLVVWQKAMALMTDVYRASRPFPKDELYALTSQIRRSAVSIPSNMAEGYGRNSTTDYVRFLRVATGSLYELQTQLEIALNLGYLREPDFQSLNDRTREVERMLTSLVNKLDHRPTRNQPGRPKVQP